MEKHEVEALFLPIRKELAAVDSVLHAAVYSSSVPLIREAALHTISGGGKRFRPALAILSAKICGYSGDTSIDLGAAIELVHTASLIHDDVLDNSDLRRGRATANAKWGNHLSILIGDYCYSIAGELLARKSTPEIVALLTQAAKETTEGEVMEVVNSNDISMDTEKYMEIIRLKTACLISASCKAGGLLADVPEKLLRSLSEYGLNLGLAFQIIDDILDFTKESSALGKRSGTDLKEGKITLPVIYALAKCDREERSVIKESLLTPAYCQKNFAEVVAILEKYNSTSETVQTAVTYVNKAKSALDQFKPSIEKETLIKFADFVLSRNF